MNELELLIRLRDEVPLTEASPAVEDAFLAAIREPPGVAGPASVGPGEDAGSLHGWARPRTRGLRERHRGRRVAAAATAAAVVLAAAGAIGYAVSREPAGSRMTGPGRPTAFPGQAGYPRLGRAWTEAQLVDYATRAAAISPGHGPGPREWIFVKSETADSSAGGGGFLFGPPDKRIIDLNWIRADWHEYAALVRGQLQTSPGGGGTLGGWKSVRYSYLSSLPTDPAQLESVILADNNPRMPWYAKPDNVAIFNAVAVLLQGETEGVWLPPKLAATMYRVLQRLRGVHFDAGTDLAGRNGIGLYMIIDGWYKRELVINPETYTFMGVKTVAVMAHKDIANDGTRHVRKGQVLGWQALLESAIVRHPGQLP